VKTIVAAALAARFPSVEKAPPKTRELRPGRPIWRIAGRELDALSGIHAVKFAQRVRRNAKLRMFRVFKLFGEIKQDPRVAAYRPVAERLRTARWMLRL
jgi:hypothetical protein